jgi:hypothetical protein
VTGNPPFPHVVVADPIKINPGPGHGGDIGAVIDIRISAIRWRRFRIVQVLERRLLARAPAALV